MEMRYRVRWFIVSRHDTMMSFAFGLTLTPNFVLNF